MKTTFIKMTFIAAVVIFALTFVTCVPELLTEGEDDGLEYTDVEYDIYGGVGNERVKSIKLYLDGVKVPVTPKQRAIQRALSAESAGASHDFFEVVFTAPAGGGLSAMVARAQWDIGSSAGISGLRRGTHTGIAGDGIDYSPIEGTTASTVFVGKKTNKTLLGVGWLTHVNDIAIDGTNGVDDRTYSVTFTVAPIKTWVGFRGVADTGSNADLNVNQRANFYGAGTVHAAGAATFVTATGSSRTAGVPPSNPGTYGSPTITTTRGGPEPFTPVQGNTVSYPLFALPIVGTAGAISGDYVDAIYTIGGLTNLVAGAGGTGAPAVPNGNSLWPAVHLFGIPAGTGSIDPDDGTADGSPRGGLQVLKRRPRFMFNGRAYETGSYDAATKVDIGPTYTTQVHGMTFDNSIELRFTIDTQSSGIFAFTFQAPVFALTTLASTNDASKFTKWFIRPADGSELYLLDNGKDDGGMVMLGDRSSLSDNWIQIITTGIGFNND